MQPDDRDWRSALGHLARDADARGRWPPVATDRVRRADPTIPAATELGSDPAPRATPPGFLIAAAP
jgi:hypothetical protein